MSTYQGTKKQSTFSKVKDKVKNSYNQYKSDLQKAYDIGYQVGWDEAHKIPNRFGAKTRATYGFNNGVKNRLKTDKYVGKYKGNKYGKQKRKISIF